MAKQKQKKPKQTKIQPNVGTQDQCLKAHAGEAGQCIGGVWYPAT